MGAAGSARLIECHEPDQLNSVIPGVAYRAVPAQAGPFRLSLASFDFGDFIFQTGQCSPMLAMANVLPSGRAFIQLPFDGLDGFILNGRPIGRGTVALYGEGGGFERSSKQTTRHLAIGLPAALADDVLPVSRKSPLLRIAAHGMYRARDAAWSHIVQLAGATFERARFSDVFAHEEARRSLRASLLHAAQALLDGNDQQAEARGGLRISADRRRIVLAADAFLRENPSRAIYTDDLCAALGVSATRMADAFRATFGISPHRFLKLRRLAMVRAALRDHDEIGSVPLVKTVALLHGFWHLGQFALDYRGMYGETPSETRARTVARHKD